MKIWLALLLLHSVVYAAEPIPALDKQIGLPGWFELQHPDAWKRGQGPGYIELFGPETAHLRIYAIGLKAAGGKYRNLEHVVDDSIFQMRDEFGGKVDKKTNFSFVGANKRTFTGRQVSGVFTQDGTTYHARVCVVPHDVEGVVLSIQFRAENEQALTNYEPYFMAMLTTLSVPAKP